MSYSSIRFNNIIQKLRANGHKITPQRLAIVNIVAKSDGHPSVEDIHGRIKDEFPTMSLATAWGPWMRWKKRSPRKPSSKF